jgi:hypothetical protein
LTGQGQPFILPEKIGRRRIETHISAEEKQAKSDLRLFGEDEDAFRAKVDQSKKGKGSKEIGLSLRRQSP